MKQSNDKAAKPKISFKDGHWRCYFDNMNAIAIDKGIYKSLMIAAYWECMRAIAHRDSQIGAYHNG